MYSSNEQFSRYPISSAPANTTTSYGGMISQYAPSPMYSSAPQSVGRGDYHPQYVPTRDAYYRQSPREAYSMPSPIPRVSTQPEVFGQPPYNPQSSPVRPKNESEPLKPTFVGFIQNTPDAMQLLEAALAGSIQHATRRPHDKERPDVIKSGSVFIYEENASGIKRWTDGFNWSPSRVSGNFLLYRETEHAFPPGEKKRAVKRKRSHAGEDTSGANSPEQDTTVPRKPSFARTLSPEQQKLYCSSLVDSYDFKEGGLLKKTISLEWRGTTHHIVSYYTLEDLVPKRQLLRPSEIDHIRRHPIRTELVNSQKFKETLAEEAAKEIPETALYQQVTQPYPQPLSLHVPSSWSFHQPSPVQQQESAQVLSQQRQLTESPSTQHMNNLGFQGQYDVASSQPRFRDPFKQSQLQTVQENAQYKVEDMQSHFANPPKPRLQTSQFQQQYEIEHSPSQYRMQQNHSSTPPQHHMIGMPYQSNPQLPFSTMARNAPVGMPAQSELSSYQFNPVGDHMEFSSNWHGAYTEPSIQPHGMEDSTQQNMEPTMMGMNIYGHGWGHSQYQN